MFRHEGSKLQGGWWLKGDGGVDTVKIATRRIEQPVPKVAVPDERVRSNVISL